MEERRWWAALEEMEGGPRPPISFEKPTCQPTRQPPVGVGWVVKAGPVCLASSADDWRPATAVGTRAGGVPFVGGTACPACLSWVPPQPAASSGQPAHALQQPLLQSSIVFLSVGQRAAVPPVQRPPNPLTRLSVGSHPVGPNGRCARVAPRLPPDLTPQPVGGDRLRRCDGSGPPAVLCCCFACCR